MAPDREKSLALDTNVLIKLANGVSAIHAMREAFLERGWQLFLPFTALGEIVWHSERGSPERRRLATIARTKLSVWGIGTVTLSFWSTSAASVSTRRICTFRRAARN
jgi:predicted nucleic acid-binding protein